MRNRRGIKVRFIRAGRRGYWVEVFVPGQGWNAWNGHHPVTKSQALAMREFMLREG